MAVRYPDTPRAYLKPSLASAVVRYSPAFRALEPPPACFCFAKRFCRRREGRQDDEEDDPFWIFRRRVLLPLLPCPWVLAPELPANVVKSSSRRFHSACGKNREKQDSTYIANLRTVVFLAARFDWQKSFRGSPCRVLVLFLLSPRALSKTTADDDPFLGALMKDQTRLRTSREIHMACQAGRGQQRNWLTVDKPGDASRSRQRSLTTAADNGQISLDSLCALVAENTNANNLNVDIL